MRFGSHEMCLVSNAQREAPQMLYRFLSPVAVLVVVSPCGPRCYMGRPPNTDCNTSGNPLHCNTGPADTASRQYWFTGRAPPERC